MCLATDNILSLLGEFKPVTLEQMESVKLMNRIDTKFLANREQLLQILKSAQADYLAQEIDGKRIATYDTLYYDTADLQMYLRHHDRQLKRQKIRIRRYVDSNLMFLEVKNKTNTGRTKKKRRELQLSDFPLHLQEEVHKTAELEQFFAKRSSFPPESLLPQERTQFQRITLVNKEYTERLTIDINLVWTNVRNGNSTTYDNLVVIELKQDGMIDSHMKHILRDLRIMPCKMSKYCMGVALTTPDIKKNRFNVKKRKIEKIVGLR